MVSYGTDASALSFSNVRCLDPFCASYYDNDLHAYFTNCIITGSQKDQINLADLSPDVAFDYVFSHCIVRLADVLKPEAYPDFLTDCDGCINNDDRSLPLFVDYNDDDYHLDTLSIAENKAIPVAGISKDIDQVDRDPATPDIGCYEYIYE
jgi:hypothetical protein